MTSRPRLFLKIILKATSPQLLRTQVSDQLGGLGVKMISSIKFIGSVTLL